MKDKHTYLLLYIGIALTLVVFVWLVMLSLSLSTSEEQSAVPTPAATQRQPTPTPIIIPFTKPSSPTLTVQGVPMQNFYTNGTIIDTNGDVSIKQNRLYDIVYLAPFEEFIIEILAKPFAATRLEAEQAFLTQLGITQEAACKLTVSLSTPYDVNPSEAGVKYGLSFCQNQ